MLSVKASVVDNQDNKLRRVSRAMAHLSADKRAKKYNDNLAASMAEYEEQNAAGKPYERYGIGQSVRTNNLRGRAPTGNFAGGDAVRSSNLSLGQTQYS